MVEGQTIINASVYPHLVMFSLLKQMMILKLIKMIYVGIESLQLIMSV